MGCESNYQISIPSNQFIIQKRNLYTQSPILLQRSEAEVEGKEQVSLPALDPYLLRCLRQPSSGCRPSLRERRQGAYFRVPSIPTGTSSRQGSLPPPSVVLVFCLCLCLCLCLCRRGRVPSASQPYGAVGQGAKRRQGGGAAFGGAAGRHLGLSPSVVRPAAKVETQDSSTFH